MNMKIKSKTKKILCFIACMLLFLGICLSFVFMNVSHSSAYLLFALLMLLFLGTYGLNRYIIHLQALPLIRFTDRMVKIIFTEAGVNTTFKIYYDDIVTALINPKGCLVIIFKSGGKSICTCSKKGKTKEKITHSYVSPPIPPGSKLEDYILYNEFYQVTLSKGYYKKYNKRIKKKKWD